MSGPTTTPQPGTLLKETQQSATPRGEGAERLPRTLAALEAGRREGLHLGSQLYVSLDFETVADLAVGEARPGEALTPDHLMVWLSSTKPVTAVAVAQLWEQGLLTLDDPVAEHLPEFAEGGKEGITVRHLLTHTGGVRTLRVGWPAAEWDEIIATICARKLEPNWVPGEKAGYHQSASWFILGELVRRLADRPFAEVVREDLFEPLGCEDCWIGMPRERYDAYAAEGRLVPMFDTAMSDTAMSDTAMSDTAAAEDGGGAAGGGGGRGGRKARPMGWEANPRRVVVPSPGGNGYGPMRGLGRFYEALLAGGRPPGGGPASRVLSPQAVEAFTARHRVGMYDRTFQHVMDWGLGFICDSKQYGADTVPYAYGRLCSRRTWGHSGYRSSTGFADPRHRLVVAWAVNGLPEAKVHEARARRVLDALYVDLGLATEAEAAAENTENTTETT